MIAWCRAQIGPDLRLHIAASEHGVCSVSLDRCDDEFVASLRRPYPDASLRETTSHPVLDDARAQLAEYFARTRREFTVPLDLHGTEFQLRVWAALQRIPFGETRTYRDIAREVGCISARAVGQANGQNPAAIIVPCHRVIGAAGDLRGFAAGVARKRLLLDLERPPTLFD